MQNVYAWSLGLLKPQGESEASALTQRKAKVMVTGYGRADFGLEFYLVTSLESPRPRHEPQSPVRASWLV